MWGNDIILGISPKKRHAKFTKITPDYTNRTDISPGPTKKKIESNKKHCRDTLLLFYSDFQFNFIELGREDININFPFFWMQYIFLVRIYTSESSRHKEVFTHGMASFILKQSRNNTQSTFPI